jgi:hypothetical protein
MSGKMVAWLAAVTTSQFSPGQPWTTGPTTDEGNWL